MTGPDAPDSPEAYDPAPYRTENLDDPALAAAYAAENEAIRVDGESIGQAFMFGIVPFGLVLLLLYGLLGDWAWRVAPVLLLAVFVGVAMVRLGLFRRYRSDLPLHLPGYGVYRGARKKRLLLLAMAAAAFLVIADVGGAWIYLALTEWVRGWLS